MYAFSAKLEQTNHNRLSHLTNQSKAGSQIREDGFRLNHISNHFRHLCDVLWENKNVFWTWMHVPIVGDSKTGTFKIAYNSQFKAVEMYVKFVCSCCYV